jgi:hypothetical protein
VRGTRHYDRQAQAIVDRHENERWQKHREHEARKETLFQAEQAARLRQVSDRHAIAQRHTSERNELVQAQERDRPRQIEARVQALSHANENQKPRQQERQPENVRPTEPFNQAAEQGHERSR